MASNANDKNLDVDYVINYRIPASGREAAINQFQKLIRTLDHVGLETEVRNGDSSSILVFVKAADEKHFAEAVYRNRIRDWLYGVRQLQPVAGAAEMLTAEPVLESERSRLIYELISAGPEDGGAGIIPKEGEWKHVESVFPLHDNSRNKRLLTQFTKKTFLSPEDLDAIRQAFGAKIAYYYAFLQSYFTFMIFPATFGLSCWVLLGSFSPIYAIVNGLWSVIFVEWWKRQEQELAIRWSMKNVHTIDAGRRGFKPDKVVKDQSTGEQIKVFSTKKRLQRQLLQIPLAVFSALALGVVICSCYAIEIFISEVYDGPFKSYLVFTPTILLTLLVPAVSKFLTGFAEQLTLYENYETQSAHDKALVSKLFVINFITSYLSISITSFVYVPFAAVLVPYLDVLGLTVKPFAENEKQIQTPPPSQFTINPDRLKNQMIYFAVTAQIVNFALETVVPYVMNRGQTKIKEMQSSRNQKPAASENDPPEEVEFLARVRHEATLPDYDVTSDLREMIIQFGYLTLFSVIWPLTPLAYFVNNWVELRGDMFKLTAESKRPNTERADSIGPWLDSLEFLSWLGSITSASLVYMFQGSSLGPDGRPSNIQLWALLLSILLSEHIFLAVRYLVQTTISKLDSKNMRKERSERYTVRKKYLEEAGLAHIMKPLEYSPDSPLKSDKPPQNTKITRQTLEEDARMGSLKDSTPSTRFWARQKGWSETEQVGMQLIEMMDIKSTGDKKSQ